MKTKDLLIVILLIAVGYLIWKNRQEQPQISSTGIGDKPMELAVVKVPYTQQFTIASEPKRFSSVKPVNGVIKLSTDAGNAGNVYVAPSYVEAVAGQHRYQIEAGNTVNLFISNLGDYYYFGESGDTFSVIAEVENISA